MRVMLMFACAALLAGAGCVERRSPVEIKAHPSDWMQPSSPDFHGLRVDAEGPANCVGCHGADLHGSADVPGCNDCHDGAGGHPGTWADPASSAFHGNAVARDGIAGCAACHAVSDQGSLRFTGGWSGVSCYSCHAGGPSGHPDGWMEPRSSSFHGIKAFTEGVTDCSRCHGIGLNGGTSGVACGECHEQ